VSWLVRALSSLGNEHGLESRLLASSTFAFRQLRPVALMTRILEGPVSARITAEIAVPFTRLEDPFLFCMRNGQASLRARARTIALQRSRGSHR
jgi:hypothetical protein